MLLSEWKCANCGESNPKRWFARDLCRKCYYRSTMTTHPCKACGKTGELSQPGKKCAECSAKAMAARLSVPKEGVCPKCGVASRFVAGMCPKCYKAARKAVLCAGCIECGKPAAKVFEGGICYGCHRKKVKPHQRCTDCGEPRGNKYMGERCWGCHKAKLEAESDGRICTRCGEKITGERAKTKKSVCQACRDILDQQLAAKTKRQGDLKRAGKLRSRRRRKFTVIEGLGGKCSCCGESRIEFLSVDHVNGDGNIHRKMSANIYRDIINLGFPRDQFRVLCMNCNCSIGTWGYCPHGKTEDDLVALREARSLARPEI